MHLPITERRIEISRVHGLNPDEFVFDGITLAERRNRKMDEMIGVQCLTYLFEWNQFPKPVYFDDVVLFCDGHREVYVPEVGDLAIYISGLPGMREQAHIGRIMQPGQILSKWGYGHAYEHRVEDVLAEYGDEVRFFRIN
ncbi:MAG TPA: hypothetical protein VHA12_00670 [Candidatus Nanoarchaeia archaeon]|nr:hypothetical protein [Candidatus Nanoarchaeia archaeon]